MPLTDKKVSHMGMFNTIVAFFVTILATLDHPSTAQPLVYQGRFDSGSGAALPQTFSYGALFCTPAVLESSQKTNPIFADEHGK